LVSVRLPATLGATRLAREAIEEIADLEPYEDLQFAAALLTTELVANAVLHSSLGVDGDVSLLAECSDECVHVEVSDAGPGFFPLPHALSRRGKDIDHGLHLVDALADRWGFRCAEGFCCVWFDLDLVSGRRAWRGREPVRFH
jgi:anti-sigma regulatory factor (Ser/Thr protein kinase)